MTRNCWCSIRLGRSSKEIKASARQRKTLAGNVKRMDKVRDMLDAQLTMAACRSEPEQLYKKRLIDKKTYNASALGLVEASQRLAAH